MKPSNEKEPIKTAKGVMQGGVLSPKLFAIYVNDMLADLNRSGFVAWALADDIVVGAIGHLQLMAATKRINDHCRRLHLNINLKKSGVMTIRADGR